MTMAAIETTSISKGGGFDDTEQTKVSSCFSSSASQQQVEVYFFTKLTKPEYILSQKQSFLVPANLERRGLSELLNVLLALSKPQPFDFLLNNRFLRTSLQCYMQSAGSTSEVALTVEYTLASPPPQSQTIANQNDWISTLSVVDERRVCVGCYDGSCTVYVDGKLVHSRRSSPVTSVASYGAVETYSPGSPSGVAEYITGNKNGKVYFVVFNGSLENSKEALKGEIVTAGIGHSDSVECVAVSRDGALAASGGWDCQIILWNNVNILSDACLTDTDSGKVGGKRRRDGDSFHEIVPRLELQGHVQTVTDICFPTADWLKYNLVSCSLDQTIRTWDALAGVPVTTWVSARALTSVSVSPTGQQICSTHDDGRVRVWDVRQPNSCTAEDVDNTKVTCLDTKTQLQLSHAYNIHKRVASCCRWNPRSSHLIASVSHDGTLRIFDVRALKLPIQSAVVTRNSSQPTNDEEPLKLLACDWMASTKVITGGEDGILRLHDTCRDPPEDSSSLSCCSSSCLSSSFSPSFASSPAFASSPVFASSSSFSSCISSSTPLSGLSHELSEDFVCEKTANDGNCASSVQCH